MASKSIVRKDVWVRIPPAAPLLPSCRADPPDPGYCVDPRSLEADYVYLLGLYLGDGMLTRMPGKAVWKLRIFQDSKVRGAASRQANMRCRSSRDVRAASSPKIGCVEIALALEALDLRVSPAWAGAEASTADSIGAVAGATSYLISRASSSKVSCESDGCRITNLALVRGKRYEYPRYFFSQSRPSISRICSMRGCDLIGVDYRQAGPRNISVARRASVAVLDEFIGPKR